MSGSAARLRAIDAVSGYKHDAESFADEAPGEVFGLNVFTKSVMKARLLKSVYTSVLATIEHSEQLDPTVADVVASAMKDWAIEKGASHYAHVFYPLTGLTAEKHDSFLEPDGNGGALPSSWARPSYRASRMLRASRTAACARRSRPAATRHGTSPARLTSSRTPTGTPSASRPCSCRGRVTRSTTRRRCSDRSRRSASRRPGSCTCSVTRSPTPSCPSPAPSRSTS